MNHAIIAFIYFLHAGKTIALLKRLFYFAIALNAINLACKFKRDFFIEKMIQGDVIQLILNWIAVCRKHFSE